MNLVHEENVAAFERCKNSDEIFGFLERGSAARPEVRVELARDQSRKRRLAEPRRPVKEHVLERLVAPLGRRDGDPQILDDAFLTDVLVEGTRTQANAVKLFDERLLRIDCALAGGGLRFRRHVRWTQESLTRGHASSFDLRRYISASRRSESATSESASSALRTIASASPRL